MGSQEGINTLGKVMGGVLTHLRSDHGPAFIARDLLWRLGKLGREDCRLNRNIP